jgi:Ca-activated chloride channel family protein
MLLWSLGIWHHRRMRRRFGNLANLTAISRVSWAGRGWLRGGLFAASLVGMIGSLSYPQMLARELRPIPMPTDMIFMLDVSPSMFARDMDPNRLRRAEQIVQRFVLNKLPDDRFALVTFNFTSVVLAYPTRDEQTLLLHFDYLNQTTEPALGTNMGAAVASGLRIVQIDEQINPQHARTRRRVLILLSDGDDNIGQWREPLAEVIRRRMRLYTIGLGTATGASFPLAMTSSGEVLRYATSRSGEQIKTRAQSRTLRDLAEATGAHFYRGEDNRQVQAAIDEVLTTGRQVGGYRADPVKHDLYFYFLSAAFLFLIAAVFV